MYHSTPEHLPKRRPGGVPPDPDLLPRQERGTTPQMIGRYPQFDVFDAIDTWDDATRKLIERRMGLAGKPMRFFTDSEVPTLRAFCDTCLAQDREPRVPVAEFIDDKLADGKLDGFQYADMPDDRDTWRLVLRGLDEVARDRCGTATFADADQDTRDGIVDALSHGKLSGGAWAQLNVGRAWAVCTRSILAGFYSHPWAWNEIGFGGPAYPRGFMRMSQVSTLEPFERPGAIESPPDEGE